MRNSILSVNYICGSIFLVCLFLDGNIAASINASNTTESTSGGIANVTSDGIAGSTSVGKANTSKEKANDTVGQVAASAVANVSGQSGTEGQPNGTSRSAESSLGSEVNASSGKANGEPSRLATNSSNGAASNSTGPFTSNTSMETTSNTIDVTERTRHISSGPTEANTTPVSSSDALNVSTTNTLSSAVKDTSTVGNPSNAGGANTTPVSSSDAPKDSTKNTLNSAARDTSTVGNSSRAGGANTTPEPTSSASKYSTRNTVSSKRPNAKNSSKAGGGNTTPAPSSSAINDSTRNTVSSVRSTANSTNSSRAGGANTTPTSSSSVSNDSKIKTVDGSARAPTVKPLVNSSSKKPGNSSGVMAGKTSRSTKKPSADSTVWPFDVSTEAITTEIPAPPPLEETDPNKKIKEKKPSPSLGPSLSSDGKPCNESYRPHETDKSKYMQLESDGIWQRRECSPDGNLVWIQELCECGFDKTAENMVYEDACPSYKPDPKNKHGYLWNVHGVFVSMPCIESLVWSQKDCMCTWDESPKSDWAALQNQKIVCQRILELKMDNNLSNSAARYEVKANSASGRGGISKIRFIHTIGATDNAAEIQNQPLTLDAFKGNDFQKAITFTLNFKILKSRVQSRSPMVLLTNGCIPEQTTLIRAPSINLSFTPGTNTFRVQFNTTEGAIDETALAEPDPNGWFKTVLYFQDQTLTLEVNGKKILSTNGLLGTIPKNLCPLLIGGTDIERNQNFYGYLDNVNIIKDCKFHEANIKLL